MRDGVSRSRRGGVTGPQPGPLLTQGSFSRRRETRLGAPPEGRWRGRGRVMRSGDVGSGWGPQRTIPRWGTPAHRELPRCGTCAKRAETRLDGLPGATLAGTGGNHAGDSEPLGTPAFPNVPASREGSRALRQAQPADQLNLALGSHRPARLFPRRKTFKIPARISPTRQPSPCCSPLPACLL